MDNCRVIGLQTCL